MKDDIFKLILGQGGSLVICCLFLYWIMGQYQMLVKTMIDDHGKDRIVYQQTMSSLTEQMTVLNSNLQKISTDVTAIKEQSKK